VTENGISYWLPVGISALSLVLASLALGWNIYRDVVLKARVVVRFTIVSIMAGGPTELRRTAEFLNIKVVNHGPGSVTIHGSAGQMSPWWRRLFRRRKHFVILNDHTNPLNPKLPAKLEVGDSLNLFLPHDANSFLGSSATHIGVTDSFSREHYSPRKDITRARRSFRETFPDVGKREAL
jgi:hypothetical protein